MRTSFLAAATVLLLAGGVSGETNAATHVTKFLSQNPADACTLSVPTTNTGVRPRATGFRNEGTVSNFVICSFDVISSDFELGTSEVDINLASIDGKAHTVSCTGVDREAATLQADFVSRTVDVTPGGVDGLQFLGADFPNLHLAGWNVSVTCNLPPGVSIITVQSRYSDDVGA